METKFNPEKTALLVIDMQNDLTKAGPDYFAPLYEMVRSNRVIDNFTRMVKWAREKRIPVVHIKTVHRPDNADVVPTITDLMLQGMVPSQMPPILVEETPGADFIEELQPAAEDYVVAKRRSGAFFNTALDLFLRTRGIDTLLVGGVVTNGCVENTIRGARERDYHVIVLSDCCAANVAQAHDYAIKNVFPGMARVRTSSEVLNATS